MIRKNMRRPLPGDIIVADRKYYKHYGIYIGSNQVIHFRAEKGHELNPSRAKVIKTSLKKFQKGDPLWVEESDEYSEEDVINWESFSHADYSNDATLQEIIAAETAA